jgi:hypothetical protein
MRKTFIILSILVAIAVLVYELLYIKQKKFDILANVGIPANEIDPLIALYEQNAIDSLNQIQGLAVAKKLAGIKKRTNTAQSVSIGGGLAATGLAFVPVIGPVLSVAAAASSKLLADNQIKKLNNELNS